MTKFCPWELEHSQKRHVREFLCPISFVLYFFFLFDHKWYFFLSWFVLLQLKYENENKHNYRNLRLNIWAYFVSKVSASGSSTSLINTDGNLALQPVKPGLSLKKPFGQPSVDVL